MYFLNKNAREKDKGLIDSKDKLIKCKINCSKDAKAREINIRTL